MTNGLDHIPVRGFVYTGRIFWFITGWEHVQPVSQKRFMSVLCFAKYTLR